MVILPKHDFWIEFNRMRSELVKFDYIDQEKQRTDLDRGKEKVLD